MIRSHHHVPAFICSSSASPLLRGGNVVVRVVYARISKYCVEQLKTDLRIALFSKARSTPAPGMFLRFPTYIGSFARSHVTTVIALGRIRKSSKRACQQNSGETENARNIENARIFRSPCGTVFRFEHHNHNQNSELVVD